MSNTTDASAAEPEAQTSRPEARKSSQTTLEKIKRFFFSKAEWEAYLLERFRQQSDRQTETPREHREVVAWLETMFASRDEMDAFLSAQLSKLQSEKKQ